MSKLNFSLLCVAIISIMTGYGIFIPLIPDMVSNFGINITIASLTLSMYGLGQFIASPIIGSFSDNHGAKQTLIIGMVGYFASLAIGLMQSSLLLLILLRIVSGIFAGAGGVCVTNYIAKYATEEEQAKYFTYTSLAIAVGMIIGPILGVVYIFNNHLVISLILIFGLGLALLIHVKLPKDHTEKKHDTAKLSLVFKDIQNAGENRINRYILGLSFLFGLICAGLEAVCLTYIIVYFKFTNTNLIIVALTALLLIVYVLYLSPKIILKSDSYKLSKQLLFTIAIGFALLTITKFDLLMIFGMIIVVGAMASLMTNLTTYITAANQRSGLMLGARNSVMSIGAVVGPIITSLLYSINPHVAIGGFAIFTVLAYWWGIRTMEGESHV